MSVEDRMAGCIAGIERDAQRAYGMFAYGVGAAYADAASRMRRAMRDAEGSVPPGALVDKDGQLDPS